MAPLSTKFSNLLVVVLAVPAILLALDADFAVTAAPFNRMQRRSAFLTEDSALQARNLNDHSSSSRGPHPHGHPGGPDGHPHGHHLEGHGHPGSRGGSRAGEHPPHHHSAPDHPVKDHSPETAELSARDFLEHEMNLIQRNPNVQVTASTGMHHHHHDQYEHGHGHERRDNRDKPAKDSKLHRGNSRGGHSQGGRGPSRPHSALKGHRLPGAEGFGEHKDAEAVGSDPSLRRRAINQMPASVPGGRNEHDPSAGSHAINHEATTPGNQQTRYKPLGDHEGLGRQTLDNHHAYHGELDHESLHRQTLDNHHAHPGHETPGQEKGRQTLDNHHAYHSELDHKGLDRQTPDNHHAHLEHEAPGQKKGPHRHRKPQGHEASGEETSGHRHHSKLRGSIGRHHRGKDASHPDHLSSSTPHHASQPGTVIPPATPNGASQPASQLNAVVPPNKPNALRQPVSQHDTVVPPVNPNAASRPQRRSIYGYELEDLD